LTYDRILTILKNHFQKRFTFYFILIIFFFLGNILGPITFKFFKPDTREFVFRLIFRQFNWNKYTNYFSILKPSILFNLITFFLLMYISILKLGIYIIPFFIFIKGIMISYGVSYLINYHGFKGFLVSIISLYPQSVFLILPAIGFSALSMDIAKKYNNLQYRTVNIIKDIYFNENLIITLSYLAMFIIVSLVESYSIYIMMLSLLD